MVPVALAQFFNRGHLLFLEKLRHSLKRLRHHIAFLRGGLFYLFIGHEEKVENALDPK